MTAATRLVPPPQCDTNDILRAIRVECPTCKARGNYECVDRNGDGWDITAVHVKRMDAANAARDGAT